MRRSIRKPDWLSTPLTALTAVPSAECFTRPGLAHTEQRVQRSHLTVNELDADASPLRLTTKFREAAFPMSFDTNLDVQLG